MGDYDIIIIGGGPAGLSAALYASRSKLKTLLIEEKRKMGGQAATYEEIENYPGILESSAAGLMNSFKEHAQKFGAEITKDEVTEVEVKDFAKTIKTKGGKEYHTKSIIIATGARPRTLGVKGEAEFRGKGVSYCATCDADFYVDLEVVVVGNGNSAIEESIFLTKFASKVTVIVIHDEGIMDADKVLQERAMKNDKIEFVWNSVLEEVKGEGLVDTVVLKNIKTGELSELKTDGVFIFIGRVPETNFVADLLELTGSKYIKANERLETNVPGIFAAGDVREKFLRQVVTAAGDGATAAIAAQKYIEEEEYWQENVLEADETVLVAFWSATNNESLRVIQELEKMDLEAKGYKLVKIDTYKNTIVSNRYEVTKIPTLIKFKDGQVLDKIINPKINELNSIL